MCSQLSKREQNKAERRAQIVEAATAIFLEEGYAATSMTKIACKLGGSKGTLWGYFGSKEELFEAVMDELSRDFQERIDDVLLHHDYSIETLRDFCVTFLDIMMERPALQMFRMIIAEGERFPELSEAFYVRGPAIVEQKVHRFFRTSFSEEESKKRGHLITAAIVGYRTRTLMAGTHKLIDASEFIDHLLEQFQLSES